MRPWRRVPCPTAPRRRRNQGRCRTRRNGGRGATKPTIDGVVEVEDDLTRELRRSGLSEDEQIVSVLDASTTSFRRGDFNGCLTNARVALQSLATAIAKARSARHAGTFDETKWGQVVAYLRKSGFVKQHEEEGLTGIFAFLSQGAHIPVGFTEE